MKQLDEAMIRKLALDSMLTLSAKELEFIKEDSKVFLAQIEALKAIDVSNVEPMTYPFEAETSWLRDDEDSYALAQEMVFKNVPLVEADYVEIVKVLK